MLTAPFSWDDHSAADTASTSASLSHSRVPSTCATHSPNVSSVVGGADVSRLLPTSTPLANGLTSQSTTTPRPCAAGTRASRGRWASHVRRRGSQSGGRPARLREPSPRPVYGSSGIRSTLIRAAVMVARSPHATGFPFGSNRSEIATAGKIIELALSTGATGGGAATEEAGPGRRVMLKT
jgi:hypothetical protein